MWSVSSVHGRAAPAGAFLSYHFPAFLSISFFPSYLPPPHPSPFLSFVFRSIASSLSFLSAYSNDYTLLRLYPRSFVCSRYSFVLVCISVIRTQFSFFSAGPGDQAILKYWNSGILIFSNEGRYILRGVSLKFSEPKPSWPLPSYANACSTEKNVRFFQITIYTLPSTHPVHSYTRHKIRSRSSEKILSHTFSLSSFRQSRRVVFIPCFLFFSVIQILFWFIST